MGVKQAFYKVGARLERSAPTILTGIAMIGMVATTVMAIKATPKAVKLLEEAEVENEAPLTNVKKIKVAAPVYLPMILAGSATMACIASANVLNKRQQAAISSAYVLVNQAYKEYRNKVIRTLGVDVDKNIRHEIVKDHIAESKEPFAVSEGSCLFYDQYSNRYFERTMAEVHDAEYHLNRNYALRGYAELNEFYEMLGLDPTDYGMTVGWSFGAGEEFYGYSWIDFEHELVTIDDDLECFNILMPFNPTADYLDY